MNHIQYFPLFESNSNTEYINIIKDCLLDIEDEFEVSITVSNSLVELSPMTIPNVRNMVNLVRKKENKDDIDTLKIISMIYQKNKNELGKISTNDEKLIYSIEGVLERLFAVSFVFKEHPKFPFTDIVRAEKKAVFEFISRLELISDLKLLKLNDMSSSYGLMFLIYFLRE